jgi:copper chaperone NosL
MTLDNRTRRNFVCCFALFILLFLPDLSWGADTGPRKHTRENKCPVCGMFVHKYPDWIGQILFRDGTVEYFDGAKDLFKYYLEIKKYNPGKTHSDIAAIYVSEYYGTSPILALDAWFVVGSDVYGPMGKELIPLATKADAEDFKKDHKGKRILRFQEITPKVTEMLD